MPNGGPDNCGNCRYSVKITAASPPPLIGAPRHYYAWCGLRNVVTSQPLWTYCRNHRFHDDEAALPTSIEGPVFAYGLPETEHVRIPWHGNRQPRVGVEATCSVCGSVTTRGISVLDEGEEVGFCSNHHYIEWWKKKHPAYADERKWSKASPPRRPPSDGQVSPHRPR